MTYAIATALLLIPAGWPQIVWSAEAENDDGYVYPVLLLASIVFAEIISKLFSTIVDDAGLFVIYAVSLVMYGTYTSAVRLFHKNAQPTDVQEIIESEESADEDPPDDDWEIEDEKVETDKQ